MQDTGDSEQGSGSRVELVHGQQTTRYWREDDAVFSLLIEYVSFYFMVIKEFLNITLHFLPPFG